MNLTKKTLAVLLALLLAAPLALPMAAHAEPVGSPATAPVTPVIEDEEVIETPPTIAEEVVVDLREVSPDTKPEDVQKLVAAAESVQMPEPENEEDKQAQEAALQKAVDSISAETKQQENQDAAAALAATGLLTLNEDGTLPENVEIKVERKINLEVKPQLIDGELKFDISASYNVVASVEGKEGSVTLPESKPVEVTEPIKLSINLPENLVDQDYLFVTQQLDGERVTERVELGEAKDGVRPLEFTSCIPFEIITTDPNETVPAN